MRRFHLATSLITAALLASACSDSSMGPGRLPYGLYRLVSVQGAPLPYGGIAYAPRVQQIFSGELLLRLDGTFEFMFSGSYGYALTGALNKTAGTLLIPADYSKPNAAFTEVLGRTYRDSIVLRMPEPGYYAIGSTPGDSLTLVLRRVAPDAVAVTSGVFVLKTVNGKPGPFISGDSANPTTLFYDTLSFRDGVFYTRSRSAGSAYYFYSYQLPGMYRGNASALTLHALEDTTQYPVISAPSRDSFVVTGDALVRRTWLPTGVVDERYERVR